jgi:23S rRNA (guanosine2251-2'-O)-methyltransferase
VIVYGRQPVAELLRAGRRRALHVWATKDPGFPFTPATAEELTARAVAEAEAYHYVHARELLGRDGLVLVLDEVQDPQNLGAICRTAEVAGALGVVIHDRRAAEVTPAVCKASAGAVEHLAIARVRNIADFLGEAKAAGSWCYGAAASGRVSCFEVDWPARVALVLGGEGKGIRPRVAKACDELVNVPMRGQLDSLNVGATAAVLTYLALQGEFRA